MISDVVSILGLRKESLPERVTVPVDSLLPADSPRSRGEDDEHIQRLAEFGEDLPPILVQRGTMRVIDGMHRLCAAILNGRRSMEVEFFDGDDEEAFIRAVELNIAHGLPLTLADRKDAAARILGFRPALSDRSVASMTGLSPKTVGAVRARPSEEIPRLDVRQGRDGRLRPLDSSEGRMRAAEVIRKNPGASLRGIAMSAGISPETARSVKEQLRAGGDPAPNRWQRPGHAVKQPTGSARGSTESSATADADESSLEDRHLADEISNILQKLYRDPALRHSEAGRRLLKLISAKAIDSTVQAAMTQESPPHSRHLLARLARHNARIWKEIASELHRQSTE
jgi:hypothetical protein